MSQAEGNAPLPGGVPLDVLANQFNEAAAAALVDLANAGPAAGALPEALIDQQAGAPLAPAAAGGSAALGNPAIGAGQAAAGAAAAGGLPEAAASASGAPAFSIPRLEVERMAIEADLRMNGENIAQLQAALQKRTEELELQRRANDLELARLQANSKEANQPTLKARIKVREPPEFDGDSKKVNFPMWTAKTAQYFRYAGLPEDKWASHAVNYLGERPKTHLHTLVNPTDLVAETVTLDWATFVAHMATYAGGDCPTQLATAQELINLRYDPKKDFCTHDLVSKFDGLQEQLPEPLPTIYKVAIYSKALPPPHREAVNYKEGRDWTAYDDFRRTLLGRGHQLDAQVNAALKRANAQAKPPAGPKGNKPNKPYLGVAKPAFKRQGQAPKGYVFKGTCHNCGKVGHKAAECRAPRAEVSDAGAVTLASLNSDAELSLRWASLKSGLSPEVKQRCFGTLDTYDPFNPACGLTDPGHLALLSTVLDTKTCSEPGDMPSQAEHSPLEAAAADLRVTPADSQILTAAGTSAAGTLGAAGCSFQGPEVKCGSATAEALRGKAAGQKRSAAAGQSGAEAGTKGAGQATADPMLLAASSQPVEVVPVVMSPEALDRSAPAECSGRQPDTLADRLMLKPDVFQQMVQSKLQRCCNVDACASGQSDALCSVYCTPGNSFYAHPLRDDDCIWLHAPLSQRELMVRHYKQQKAANPRLSACILLPAKRTPDQLQLTAGMMQLAYFSRGADVFIDPAAGTAVRARLDLAVWYDPPVHPASEPQPVPAAPATVAAASLTANMLPTRHRMQLRATVAGVPDVPVLLDPGAEQGPVYLNKAFCDLHGIAVTPATSAQLQGWTGESVSVYGSCKVVLKMGKFACTVTSVVADGPAAFPVILADDFLSAHGAVLNYTDNTCTFVRNGKKHVLTVESPAVNCDRQDRSAVLSYSQAKRFVKPGVHYALVLVRPNSDVSEQPPPDTGTTPSTELLPDQVIQQIVSEYPAVFTDKAPHGGSQIRADVEVIPVTDNRPVMKGMFRYSPLELAEIERHVKELLELGYIQPSSSPYGAPVLFVKKPRSDELRMVIDYRALNKLTRRNAFPLPRIDVLLDHLAGSKVFSLIDLRQAYHQIQLQESDVPKTAFRTPIGHYEYLTLSFGLVNAPAVFQSVMNRIFGQYLYKFVLVYLDDILIFSKTAAEHAEHLRMVLNVLRDQQLTVAVHKCAFNQSQVLFLGHIISSAGVKADPAKVAAILGYPRPPDVTGLRSFLGMTNYFRKFIYGYARVVHPLTDMLKNPAKGKGAPKKHCPLSWTAAATAAFEQIKQALASAPVLALPDWSADAVFDMICDASYQGLAGILMQHGKPVAFESRKLNAAESNYSATDLEMLAVVYCTRKWRCYIEGREARVFTDHKPNTFFDTANMLTRRSARWVEALQGFRLQWNYKPGVANIADPLSRNPVLLLSLTARRARPQLHESLDFKQQVRSGYSQDPWFSLESTAGMRRQLSCEGGLYYMGNRLVIPAASALRTACIAECHDTPYCGHVGRSKTLHNVKRYFWWPGMHADVAHHVATCESCQRIRSRNRHPYGLLQPLPVPQETWQSVSCDFVTCLPPTTDGFTAVAVFVDRLSKMVRLAPCHDTITAEDCADMFVQHVFKSHGLPEQLVSDRDTRFTSEFWAALMAQLGVTRMFSSAYHPETDGQTERVNRVMEDMLRHFVDPTQATWAHLLPLVEFAINDSWHESTQAIPFVMVYGKRPALPLDLILRGEGAPESASTGAAAAVAPTVAVSTRAQLRQDATQAEPAAAAEPAAVDAMDLSDDSDSDSSDMESEPDAEAAAEAAAAISARKADAQRRAAATVNEIQVAVIRAKKCLHAAQQRQKRIADLHRTDVQFAAGEQVLLNTQNLTLKMKGSNKLLPRFIGPFTVVKQVNTVAYRLELPEVLKIHDVFHVSLLKQYKPGGRTQPPPLPLIIDGVPEYEVECILQHRKKGVKRPKTEFLVKWLGYGEEHNSWEPEPNLRNCPLRLNEYWARVAQWAERDTQRVVRRSKRQRR